MKKKVNRDLILILIFIPIFLWCAFYISNNNKALPDYSVLNKSKTGCSVFFEALREFNYPVVRTLRPINEVSRNAVQVIAPGGEFDIGSQEVKNWVELGGILVYLNVSEVKALGVDGGVQLEDNVFVLRIKKGTIIGVDGSKITNGSLLKNTEAAYLLLKELSQYEHNKIYFNETYLFSDINNSSLWDYVPLQFKFICYQILIVILVFFYYKGKRFGKAIPLYDEVERIENEYLYSAAALYKQAKCWDLMLDCYYKSFLRLIKHKDINWIEWWRDDDLPSLDKAIRVYEFMAREEAKINKKECVSIIKLIEELTNILKKRREQHWRILKKPQ